MSFLTPIAGLIAGVAGSVLVVLFWMLKLRRRPVGVSSTLLWKRAVRDMEGNVPWQMARPSVLLFLQLLAVVLLAMAIARPVGSGGASYGSQIAIVIDAGASMEAVVDQRGTSRLEVAKSQARDLVRTIGNRSASTKFRVVRAGAEPMLMAGKAGSWRQARAAIDLIEGSDVSSDLGAALVLVQDMGRAIDDEEDDEEDGEDDRAVAAVQSFVLSDVPREEIGDHFDRVVVQYPVDDSNGQTGDQTDVDNGRSNIGIVLVGGQRDQVSPERVRIFVTVAGKVDGLTGVMLRAVVEGEVVASKAVELLPDDRGVVESATTLVFSLKAAAMVEISIGRDDALESDNFAWILMPDPSPILTTIVALDGLADPLLVDVISAVTGGAVVVVGQGESIGSETRLVVFDRVINRQPIGIPSMHIGGQVSENPTSESRALQRVLTWDRSHPVMQDVDLSGLTYMAPEEGLEGTRGVGGIVLAQGRQGAVIVETVEDGGAGVRKILIGFAIEDSNWGVQVSMPMFFTNVVGYLLPGTSGAGVVWRIGEPIEVQALQNEVQFVNDDGVKQATQAVVGSQTQLRGIDRVGLYTIRGGDVEQIGVSLLDRVQTMRAANQRSASDQMDDDLAGAGAGMMNQGGVEIWRWFVLAAMGVLMMEWVLDLWRRRI